MDDSSRMLPAGKTQAGHGASFDEIKHVDEHGEWWSARELQPLMDYARWDAFLAVIEKAAASLAIVQGESAGQANFRQVTGNSGGPGRPSVDYRLTRFGAYLAAVAGDDTKLAVAEARIYFAVRTREAEVAEAEWAELPEWAQQQIVTIRRVGKLEAEQQRHEVRLTEVESRVDGLEGGHGWYTALGYARKRGLPTSLTFTRKLGRLAADLCRKGGVVPEQVNDGRYGQVGSYPEDVLDEASASMRTDVA